MKILFKNIFGHTFGKLKYQKFYEKLIKLAMLDLNVGLGYDPSTSGKIGVITYFFAERMTK